MCGHPFTMSRSAFLISYDNGESYEDHQVTPICIVPTKKRAEVKIAAWMTWAKEAASRLPPLPDWQNREDAHTQLIEYDTARNALKVPHGFDELRYLTPSPYGSAQGSLTFAKLPVLK